MSPNKFVYVANWKAYFTPNQAYQWAKSHKEALGTLSKNSPIIICPSFDALSIVAQEIKGTPTYLAAQDCSAHHAGPYTGQVLSTSLKEIGCTYCIIGHSEVRQEYHETPAQIAAKACLLLDNGITPIICIGETAHDYDLNRGAQAIEQQLTPILTAIKKENHALKTIAIGYEPLWAIGTSIVPKSSYLAQQLEAIKRLCNQHLPDYQALLLYGGSIDETNALTFKNIPLLDGILIGHASTDFQKLQKIVLS